MSFTLPRQACRCGHVFRTMRAHLAHADLCEPLPHDHPADVGLVLIEGEWEHKSTPTVAEESTKTYVRAADRPSTDYQRTCTICNATFERPRRRGRPPTKCEDCR